jgi:hypothetical protein
MIAASLRFVPRRKVQPGFLSLPGYSGQQRHQTFFDRLRIQSSSGTTARDMPMLPLRSEGSILINFSDPRKYERARAMFGRGHRTSGADRKAEARLTGRGPVNVFTAGEIDQVLRSPNRWVDQVVERVLELREDQLPLV